nr:MAG TPA: hypothetical protein [Caudoviricetes sp.]
MILTAGNAKMHTGRGCIRRREHDIRRRAYSQGAFGC